MLIAEPRLLLAKITAPALNITLVVAHAPCHADNRIAEDGEEAGTDGKAQVTKWWRRLEELCGRHEEVVVMLDANARVGSLTDGVIGGGGFAQQEDYPGALLKKTCQTNRLHAPSTVGDYDAEGYTWTSTAGRQHRIDYILVPARWSTGVVEQKVVHDMELLARAVDHDPVSLRIRLETTKGKGENRWRGKHIPCETWQEPGRMIAFSKEPRCHPAATVGLGH